MSAPLDTAGLPYFTCNGRDGSEQRVPRRHIRLKEGQEYVPSLVDIAGSSSLYKRAERVIYTEPDGTVWLLKNRYPDEPGLRMPRKLRIGE